MAFSNDWKRNESELLSDEGERSLDEGERFPNDYELSMNECELAIKQPINLLDFILDYKQRASFLRRSHEGCLPPSGSSAGVFLREGVQYFSLILTREKSVKIAQQVTII